MKKKKRQIYFFIFLITLLSLSVGYSTLNSVLIITGTSAIQKNTWNINFENIKVRNGSVEATIEPIVENNTINFSFVLDKRGDFYEFTIDVVNSGTLDAMIGSVVKTQELTDEQKKYLNYTISYDNGDEILEKHSLKKEDFLRLRVKVEFKNDITASDLPQTQQILNLGFNVNFIQNDDTEIEVLNNGGKIKPELVSGDLDTVGSEICIDTECFYLISSDENNVTLLSKYNLEVGNIYDGNAENIVYPLENPSGIQNSNAIGVQFDADWNTVGFPYHAVTYFSSSFYWLIDGSFDSKYQLDNKFEGWSNFYYVYDSNSIQYQYVENYKNYLEKFDVDIIDSRLISTKELANLGCGVDDSYITCLNSPPWVYSTSYWTSSASKEGPVVVFTLGYFAYITGDLGDFLGCRPVITIPKNSFWF